MAKRSFSVFCLMFFTISFGVAAMAALVPSIARHFTVPPESAFKLTWLYMLPYGIFALFWAPLTRVIKVKNLLLVTTLGFSLSAFSFSVSQTITQAFLFRFCTGIFGCSFVPLVLICIGKTVPADKKAQYIGTLFGLSYLSSFVSVLLSGFLSWRLIYLVPAMLGVIVFFLIFKHSQAFDFREERFSLSYLSTVKDKSAAAFFIAVIAGSFLYHSVQQRLGLYFSAGYHLNQLVISSLFTVSTLTAIIFEFAGGHLNKHVGTRNITRVGFIAMSVFVFFLMYVKNYRFLYAAIILWGAGWALTHVGLSTYLAHFPDAILRDASSLNSALRFSFGGLGAFAGGLLASAAGFRPLFLCAGLSILALGIFMNKIVCLKKGAVKPC